MAIALTMTRGDDREFDLFVLDQAGVAVDISAWGKFWFTVKRGYADTDLEAVFQLSTPSGGLTIQSASGGQVRAIVARALTIPLANRRRRFYLDFQGLDPLGHVKTIDSGFLVMSPSSTEAVA